MNNIKPLIYDAHACPPFDADKDLSGLEQYKNAGFTFVSVNAGYGEMTADEILPRLDRFNQYIQSNNDKYLLVRKTDDIEFCQANNLLGIAFDLEGADALSSDIEMLDIYKQHGVKQLLLAYNKNNSAAGGCLDDDDGLTAFGRSIVMRMNEIGLLIDCSHTGMKTSLDILSLSSQPVIFSHSNPKGLYDHARNITDEQIKLCAASGGVIGINGISIFLGKGKPTLSKFADHIDYIAQLVGIKHVGIGLDYIVDHKEVKEAVEANLHLFPKGQQFDEVELLHPELIPHLFDELTRRGYSSNETQDILGNNFMRVACEVWGQ